MAIKIATWNINSLRIRLPHVIDWLVQHQPDILSLQETKIPDDIFPVATFNDLGYEVVFNGQKAYNGVATLSKKKPTDLLTHLPGIMDDQRRVMATTIDGVRVLNLYVPNGQDVQSDKYLYKLAWLQALKRYLEDELKMHKKMVVLGDFNIAPHDLDVHDPIAWQGQVLCTEKERAAFQDILSLGFKDCFRLQAQPLNSFSWWDYRLGAFKRNLGMRIDHILATDSLALDCIQCGIDKAPRGLLRPSDHTPVFADFL